MLQIAIIGAAHAHVDYVLNELGRDDRDGFRLIGVQDRDRSIAQEHADRFGVLACDRPEQLLDEGVDLAVVAGVYGDRGSDVVRALEAGAHVLVDKPLCTTLAQLDAIEEAAARTGRTVSLLLEKRGYPETRAALEAVRAGALGEVVGVTSSGPHKLNASSRPDWFFRPAEYGGIIGDLAVHDLDAALLFAPADAGTVAGATAAPLEGHPDFARYGAATLVTDTAVITSEVSWLTPQASDIHGDYRMRLVGTSGTAEIFWARGRVELTTADEPLRELELPAPRRPAEDALDAFRDGRVPEVDTDASVTATRLALLAQASASQSGAPLSWTRAGDHSATRQERS